MPITFYLVLTTMSERSKTGVSLFRLLRGMVYLFDRLVLPFYNKGKKQS